MSGDAWIDTWRLTRGRHRAASRLAIALLALGCAATVVRAMADAFAGVPAIGGILDGIDKLLRLPIPPALAAFALTILFCVRVHPALAPTYLAALTITPWRPGRRLPLGDLHLASTLVLLPAVAIGLLFLLRQPSAALIAVGATLAYGVVTIFTGLVTRHALVPLGIAALMVGLIAAATSEAPSAVPLALLSIVAASGLAQRSILKAAFGTEGVADVRRLTVQRRSTLGWFENLPLARRPRNVKVEAVASLAIGSAVALVGGAVEATDGAPWRGILTTTFFVVGCVRFGLTFVAAPLSFGPIARVLNARWIVWRMDRLLIFPAAMLILIGLTNVAIQTPRSHWNPAIAGACAAGAAVLCWWVAPRALAWQTTGASRILTTANKQQKQAEANLKRLTDPQPSRGPRGV